MFLLQKTFIIFLLLFNTLPPTNQLGYDSANSCNPNGKLSRKGRAQTIAAIPCNLGEQNYCNQPGSLYPWHAVRRFVHENQGLMKRMYGEIRHISILRDEMDLKNEINAEDIVDTQERYLRDSRKSKILHTDYQIPRNNEVLMEPHFRPVSTTTTTTLKPTTINNELVETKKLEEFFGLDDGSEESKEENEDNNELDNNTYYDVVAENIKYVKSPQPDPKNETKSSETATISTTLKIVQQKIEAFNNATIKTTTSTTTTTQTPRPTLNATISEPASKITELKGKPVLMEGQLFQDTIQKEPVIGPNMKGV